MNQQQITIFELKVSVPFMQKGSKFLAESSTGLIYWYEEEKLSEYPLRQGLSGFLWLLMTEKKYIKIINTYWEDI